MREYFSYLRIQSKVCIRLLSKMIICVFSMLIGLAVIALIIGTIMAENSMIEKVRVAAVIPETETDVALATRYAATIDGIEEICDFSYYEDEEKAIEDLKEGKIQVCIFFSEGFYEQVDSGYGLVQKIYVSDDNSLSFALFKNVIEDGIKLLQTSAAGVYSACDTGKKFDAPLSRRKIDKLMMDLYIDKLLYRGEMFVSELVSPIGQLSVERYVFFCFYFISILISGLGFATLYKKQNSAIEQKLRINGISHRKIFITRTAMFSFMIWTIALLVYLTGIFLTARAGFNLVYFDVRTLVKSYLVCVLMALIFNAVYYFCRDVQTGTMVVLLLIILIILASGIIVPGDFLPMGIRKIQQFLHTSTINKLLLEILYGNIL